jgi:hypothetical protein
MVSPEGVRHDIGRCARAEWQSIENQARKPIDHRS